MTDVNLGVIGNCSFGALVERATAPTNCTISRTRACGS